MIRFRSIVVVAGLTLCAAPLVAQQGVIFRFSGGGYSHTRNLSATGPEAHFKVGLSASVGLGYQFNKYLAVQGDATYGRTKGLGDVNFIGDAVNRYYLGGRVDLRYPLSGGFVPYAFGGAGRIRVDQSGIESKEDFQHFSRFATTFGAGLNFAVPNTRFSLLAEGKALAYKWVATPFKRNQLDLSYSIGGMYRFAF